MNVTITRVETTAYYDTEEPGATIKIRATVSPSMKRPGESHYNADEVTQVELDLYSDEHHVFKPLRPGSTWVKPLGYVLTKKGSRNKTKNFGRLTRDLSSTEEHRIIAALRRDPNLPEALREEVSA